MTVKKIIRRLRRIIWLRSVKIDIHTKCHSLDLMPHSVALVIISIQSVCDVFDELENCSHSGFGSSCIHERCDNDAWILYERYQHIHYRIGYWSRHNNWFIDVQYSGSCCCCIARGIKTSTIGLLSIDDFDSVLSNFSFACFAFSGHFVAHGCGDTITSRKFFSINDDGKSTQISMKNEMRLQISEIRMCIEIVCKLSVSISMSVPLHRFIILSLPQLHRALALPLNLHSTYRSC